MRTLYFFALIASGILTALGLIPGMTMVLMFLTIGLAPFVLLAATNLFVVLLCLMPAAMPFVPRWAGYPVSVALLAAAFLSPGHMSRMAAEEIVAPYKQTDTQSPGALAHTAQAGLELIAPAPGGLGEARRILGGEKCSTLCKRLLHSGQFDWVRVTTEQRRNVARHTILVRRGDVENCAEVQCFVYAKDSGAEPAVTIHLAEMHLKASDFPNAATEWADPQLAITMTVFDGPATAHKVAWRQTQVNFEQIPQPAVFAPLLTESDVSLPPMIKATMRHNALDPKAIFTALGLNLDQERRARPVVVKPKWGSKKRRPPTASDTALVSSVLDQEGPLAQKLQSQVGIWVGSLRDVPSLSDADVALIMRIAQDARIGIRALASPRKLFGRHENLQEVMLPWLFDEMERGAEKKRYTTQELAGAIAWSNMSAATLAPYASRYQALIKEGTYADELIVSAGRYGFDPLLTVTLYAEANPDKAEQVTKAICRSDKEWYAGFAPMARIFAKRGLAKRPERLNDKPTANALRFLARTGHREEVAEMIRASTLRDKKKLTTVGFAGPMGRDDHPWGPCRR